MSLFLFDQCISEVSPCDVFPYCCSLQKVNRHPKNRDLQSIATDVLIAVLREPRFTAWNCFAETILPRHNLSGTGIFTYMDPWSTTPGLIGSQDCSQPPSQTAWVACRVWASFDPCLAPQGGCSLEPSLACIQRCHPGHGVFGARNALTWCSP